MIKVLFNNKCPICSREINHYKRLDQSNINWIDINNIEDSSKIFGKTHRELLRRLHVIYDEQVYQGIDAFIIIWKNIPKYRFLSKIISSPIIYQISYILYEMLALILFYINFNQLKDNS